MFCDYIFHVTATKLYHPEHFSGDVTLFCGLAYRPPTLESQDPVESQQAPAIRRFALRSALHVIAQMFAFLLELWVSLEEHQDALELIMSKYRKQMLQLMVAKKAVDTEPVLRAHQSHSAVRTS